MSDERVKALEAELTILKLDRAMETMANTKTTYRGTYIMALYESERAKSQKLVEALRDTICQCHADLCSFPNCPCHDYTKNAIAEYETGETK